MCLAVPMQVTELDGLKARVSAGGVIYEVQCDLVPDVKIGDYVIVHTGYAIEILVEDEAEKTLSLFEELKEDA